MKNPEQTLSHNDPIAEQEYTKLRLWYLARLRKLAIAQAAATAMTPAALIAADRESVERRILNNANPPGRRSRQQVWTHKYSNALTIAWAALSVLFALWLFVLEGFDFANTASAYFQLTLGWFIGDGPEALFQAGLPSYFLVLPVITLGFPVLWCLFNVLFVPPAPPSHRTKRT